MTAPISLARFLVFEEGQGLVTKAEGPIDDPEWENLTLASPDLLAVNALGQLATHPRIKALRDFITGWHLSYLSAQDARGAPEAGPREHLSKTGDNLANVIQYLRERHPEKLDAMLDTLRRRVPRLERVDAEVLADGRLLLQIKDAPFERPILSRFASDGTLKLLAYLVLLHDPEPYPLIGIEEPENFLYPKLLAELAEECNLAFSRTQMLVTTHSPYFVNGLQPEQVQVLYRGEDGYTRVKRAADIPGINEMMAEGAKLGDLWMEGHFGLGDAEGV